MKEGNNTLPPLPKPDYPGVTIGKELQRRRRKIITRSTGLALSLPSLPSCIELYNHFSHNNLLTTLTVYGVLLSAGTAIHTAMELGTSFKERTGLNREQRRQMMQEKVSPYYFLWPEDVTRRMRESTMRYPQKCSADIFIKQDPPKGTP